MPLSGVKVLDLTRVLSGPFCTALLGDLGADIIKVEAPEGDSVRNAGAMRDGLSWYFAQFNRNKRSIRLDLRKPEAKAILARLIEQSDVLVENFRPGVLARFGFDEDRLKALRPSLVICSINGFGSTGPYRDRPAFDFIAQAMSGFMSVNGGPDDPPLRSGLPISDLVAGLYAALSIAAAVLHARRTGQGQRAEVSLTNGLVSLLAYIATNYLRHGRAATAQRQRPSDRRSVWAVPDPGRADRAGAGGRCVLRALGGCAGGTGAEDRSAVCNATGPGGQPGADQCHRRRQVGGEYHRALGRDAEQGRRALRSGKRCGGGVPGPSDPGAGDGDRRRPPRNGIVRMLGFPIKLSGTPCRVRHPAPALGEHSDEVLAELGYSDAERAAWRRDGVV